MELEQLVHRPQGDVVDFLEIERRVDLGGHALQDLELCGLACELRRRSLSALRVRHCWKGSFSTAQTR